MISKFYIGLLSAMLLLMGCEREIELELPAAGDQWVVEGFIENGQPPYVLLTRTTSFFGENSFSSLPALYVHNAQMTVTYNGVDYPMTEYCLRNLPPNLQPLIADFLGVQLDSLPFGFDLCAYANLQLLGQPGGVYRLTIQKGDTVATASTYIPQPVPIDSTWFVEETDVADSLVRLWVAFDEPDTLGNFYRYFTKRNDEPFYPGLFGSVLDDQFFNAAQFRFNLDRGYPQNADIDFDTYGLFIRGDTIITKISSIDRAHFNFWETTENQLRSGGPFASPTYILSNVDGALGIWGGYGSAYDTLVVPK